MSKFPAEIVTRTEASAMWKQIDDDTPKDRLIIVFAPGDNPQFVAPLSDMVCLCQWHEDAGWCVDELRHPTHWQPYERPN